MGEVLRLLVNDPERLRFAAHLAVNFDLFEVAPILVELAWSLDDRDLKLSAARLCGNPAVSADLRRHVADLLVDDPFGQIRLDPSYMPKTADEQLLYTQCWPGVRARSFDFPQRPTTVLDWSFSAEAVFRLAARLDRAGASVRRLAGEAEIPDWFGLQSVLICDPRTRIRALNRYPAFPERQILVVETMPTTKYETERLLRRLNSVLSGPHKLNLAATSSDRDFAVWAPEVFTAGVYPTREAAFLAGSTTSSLHYLKKRGVIEPLERGILLWTFRDVVAVRTWVYLKSKTVKQVSSKVITVLAGFAGDSEAVRLGATSDGRVWVDEGDGWADVVNNEQPLLDNIADFDDVFQPFRCGGGKTIGLLQASKNTELLPTVLNGTPHLKGHRISAKALASLANRGGRRAIESSYPELSGTSFEDTIGVGNRLLSAA